jgi:hypothetical protein
MSSVEELLERALRSALEEVLKELRGLKDIVGRPLPTILSKEQAMHELGDISDSKLKSMVRKGQFVRCRVGDGWGYPSSEVLRIKTDFGIGPSSKPIPTKRERLRAKRKAADHASAIRKLAKKRD